MTIKNAFIPSLLLLYMVTGLAQMVRADESLVLDIHPYKSAQKLIESYTPLKDYLQQQLGRPVTLSISADYQSHIDAIGKDEVDIAYMGPASYVRLVEQYGPKPLLACQVINGKPTFQGKIIIRQDSPLTSLTELKGKRFAFGDRNSTMSHLVPRYMLWQAGVPAEALATYRFLGSHDNVALAVLAGDFDAGAVKEEVFYKYQDRGLKVLTTTPAFSEHVFVASNKMDQDIVEKLREAFEKLAQHPDGRQILSSIKPGTTAMHPVQDTDYDNLREVLFKLREQGIWQ